MAHTKSQKAAKEIEIQSQRDSVLNSTEVKKQMVEILFCVREE